MQIDPTIFKAYDIRGIYPDQLNEDIAYRIGRAYSQLLVTENPDKKLQVVVGHDMRLSSPSLKTALVTGLLDSGVDVVEIGLASTPTFYFATAFYGYDGGIQVSASHNPKEYNGFKLVRARAVPISGETGITAIRDRVLANNFSSPTIRGIISSRTDVLTDLIKDQRKNINWQAIKPFKIVVDTANAMGTLDIQAMFTDLPCQLIKINFTLDGNFPAHPADPNDEKNLTDLKQAVVNHQADLGIAIDGDGDRCFFIDDQGQTMPQPVLRGIMAQLILKDHPDATVCYDIRPGKITQDLIEAVGGKAVVTKAGHSLIKEHMLKVDAVFGGESSGHYFYKFPYGTFEAPVVLILKFLEFLSGQNQSLSQVIKPYQKYFHSGEINSTLKDTQTKIKEIAQTYSDAQISYIDGITIEYPDFWFNIRPSNTEPLLRLNLEAVSQQIMEQKRDEVLQLIRN